MLDSPLLFEDYIEYVGSRKHHLPKKVSSEIATESCDCMKAMPHPCFEEVLTELDVRGR